MFKVMDEKCIKKANYIRIALKAQIEKDESSLLKKN